MLNDKIANFFKCALDEGKLNDTIQVRNSKTGKIVTGIVDGPGIVRVIF